MPSVDVVGVLILREEQVLLAQRASGERKGKWEFPGGKVERGETQQIALTREIYEELGATISVGKLVDSVRFQVGSERLELHCYWACIIDGEPTADEHYRLCGLISIGCSSMTSRPQTSQLLWRP